ncbi:MAG: hypothetical protein HYX92_17590 [Chloroflexi bacterium]|nr:hypothetical protein [Chloroflexota bacterium]
MPDITPTPLVSITLKQGWNLISTPGQLVDPSLRAVLDGMADKVYHIRASGVWDYAVYLGGDWVGDLKKIEPGKSYWVRSATGGRLVFNLSPKNQGPSAPSYELGEGWNMIGYVSDTASMPVDTYLASLLGKWITLYRNYGAAGWEVATPGGFGFKDVELGQGYLIYLLSEGTLTPPLTPSVPRAAASSTGGEAG